MRYVDGGVEDSVVGMSVEIVNPSPSISWISWGFSRGDDGVERTTEGMRLWPRFFSAGAAGLSDAVCSGGGAPDDSNSEGLLAVVGSHSTPGFTMRLIVSPSWTLYSFSSLASASALPFKRSRCAEAGGARGWSAIWVLMEEMGSAGETGMVVENGGLRDLNVIWSVVGANWLHVQKFVGSRLRLDVPDDGCASSFFNSGGWGTSSWVCRRFRGR